MMTLEEAIKHCEEVAEKYCEKVEEGLTADDFCDSCASEHRQLAEWLKDLKNYRIFKEVLYSKCDEWCKFPEYKERGTMCGACEIGGIKDLLENALEEVKADVDN